VRKQGISKIAFFTEGQTEQIFVEKLLIELVAHKKIRIESRRMMGGRKFRRTSYKLRSVPNGGDHEYFALIVNSDTDGRVASDVRDEYATLMSAGYSAIVAIRDVFPNFTRADIPRLRAGIESVMPREPIIPTLVLATMETEAWFIAEYSHFRRLDASLTLDRIQQSIGTDLANDDIEGLAQPAQTLNSIYQLVTLGYTKSATDVERTVSLLDFQQVRTQLSNRTPSIMPLIGAVDTFFQ
jgi:hypothetical protein